MTERSTSSNVAALTDVIRTRGSSTKQWAVQWLVRERSMTEKGAVKAIDDAVAQQTLSARDGNLMALRNPQPVRTSNLNPRGYKMASKRSSKKHSSKKSSKKAVLSKDQLAALEEGRARLAAINSGKAASPSAIPAIISSKSAKKASAKRKSARKASAKKTSVKKASVRKSARKASVKAASVRRASAKRESVKKTSARRASAKRRSAKRASKKPMTWAQVAAKSAKKASARKASAKRASAKRKSARKASRKSAKRASVKRASAKRASRRSAKRASVRRASAKRRSSRKAPRRSAKRRSAALKGIRRSAKRRSAKRASAKRASRRSAKRHSVRKAAARKSSRKSAKRASAKRRSARRASAKCAAKKTAKRRSARKASAKRRSARKAPRRSAKRRSANRASVRRAAARKSSRKSAKRASARKAAARKSSRKSAKRASVRRAAARKSSHKVSSRPRTKKAANRKGTKMSKQLSAKQLAALAKGRAKRAAKAASKPKAAKKASAKRRSARKASKRSRAYKSLQRSMKLMAPKHRKAKPRKVHVSLKPNQGAQIVIRRSYSQNPVYNMKDVAIGGAGLFAGVILSDVADRLLATRAPANQTDALTKGAAAAAIQAPADGYRMAVQGGATALLGVGAFMLRDKSPAAAFGVGGMAVAFGGKFLTMLVTDVLMPRIFKASTTSTASIGDRLYFAEQIPASTGAAALPYGFRRPGYQGIPGFLGAPQAKRTSPFEQAPADVGPVATGVVGCRGGMAGQQQLDMSKIFPGAKHGCSSCRPPQMRDVPPVAVQPPLNADPLIVGNIPLPATPAGTPNVNLTPLTPGFGVVNPRTPGNPAGVQPPTRLVRTNLWWGLQNRAAFSWPTFGRQDAVR